MAKSAQASSSDPSATSEPKSEQEVPYPSFPVSKSQPNASASNRSRALSEVVEGAFPSFDHQAAIVGPFEEETNRDQTFEQEIGQLILDLVLETHAWAAARPKHESQFAVGKFEKKIADIMEIEKEQDRTRARLLEFMRQMKNAVDALTIG